MDENSREPPRRWAPFLAHVSYAIAAGFLCFAGYAILGSGLPSNVVHSAILNSITWFCTAKTIPKRHLLPISKGHLLRLLVLLACDLLAFLLLLWDLMGSAGPQD